MLLEQLPLAEALCTVSTARGIGVSTAWKLRSGQFFRSALTRVCTVHDADRVSFACGDDGRREKK
jgi:hypothetical protein